MEDDHLARLRQGSRAPAALRLAKTLGAGTLMVFLLAGCFLFGNGDHLISYSAMVWLDVPEGGGPPVCEVLSVHVLFGTNVLMDETVRWDDPLGYRGEMEPYASKAQPYVTGMPLEVDVSCFGVADEHLGAARYEAALDHPRQSAFVAIYNRLPSFLEPEDCVTPLTSSGVTPCVILDGFTPTN